jgi:hypothetical protein
MGRAPDPHRVPSVPLACWAQLELQRLSDLGHDRGVLGARLGVSDRTVYCWEHELDGDGRPVFSVPAATVDDALTRAGIPAWVVFPWLTAPHVDVHDRFCGRCRELVACGTDLLCPWCESQTEPPGTRPQRWCPACDRAVYPDNSGCCERCGKPAKGMPHEPCECGNCGQLVRRFDRWGVRRRWRPGHSPAKPRNRGQMLPAGPFAEYLRTQVHRADPLAAVAQQHGMTREEVAMLVNGGAAEVSRGTVANALHRARIFGQRRGAPRRTGVPGLRELYRLLVCPRCGKRKAVHAELCRGCRIRQNRVDEIKPPRPRRRLKPEVEAEALRLRGEGLGATAIARQLLARTSYANERSLAKAIERMAAS